MKYLYFYKLLSKGKDIAGDGRLIATLHPLPTSLATLLSNKHPLLKSKSILLQAKTNPNSLPYMFDYEIRFPKESFELISREAHNINSDNLSEFEDRIISINEKYKGNNLTKMMSDLTLHTSNYPHQIVQMAKLLNRVKVDEDSVFAELPVTHVLIKRHLRFNLNDESEIRLK